VCVHARLRHGRVQRERSGSLPRLAHACGKAERSCSRLLDAAATAMFIRLHESCCFLLISKSSEYFPSLSQRRAGPVAVVISMLIRAACRHHHQCPGQWQLPADIRPLLHRWERTRFLSSQKFNGRLLKIVLAFALPTAAHELYVIPYRAFHVADVA